MTDTESMVNVLFTVVKTGGGDFVNARSVLRCNEYQHVIIILPFIILRPRAPSIAP